MKKNLTSEALTTNITALIHRDVIKDVPSGTPNLLLSSNQAAPQIV